MRHSGFPTVLACAALIASGAVAQTQTELQPTAVEPAPVADLEPDDADPAPPTAASDDEQSLDDLEDAITRQLNSGQKLERSFTLERYKNGELVDRSKRTVTIDEKKAERLRAAGASASEQVLSAYDGELLSRPEAREEAQSDFVLADRDANGLLTAAEFVALVDAWRRDPLRGGEPEIRGDSRDSRIEAFLAEISPAEEPSQPNASATQKFTLMAGPVAALSEEEYVREYLRDFDAADQDRDLLLSGDQLELFRALARGDAVRPTEPVTGGEALETDRN